MCASASLTVCTKSSCAKILAISQKDICADERRQRTWMLSWSNRQSWTVMLSGWFGARTVERDLPLNMGEMGDSAELAYTRPCIHQQHESQHREEE